MKSDPIVIILSGNPVPWTPSRVVGGKYAFSPRFREKEHHQWEVASQYKGDLIEGAIFVQMEFYMSIPTATSKKQRSKMLSNQIQHTKKPDIDNCFKYGLDCVKGLIFKDDNQVMKISATKCYAEIPKSIITILKWE